MKFVLEKEMICSFFFKIKKLSFCPWYQKRCQKNKKNMEKEKPLFFFFLRKKVMAQNKGNEKTKQRK